MNISTGIYSMSPRDNDTSIRHKTTIENTNLKANKGPESATSVQVSAMAKNFSNALKILENEESVRPEMVEKGKDIIKNWQSPSDTEVDNIISNILREV